METSISKTKISKMSTAYHLKNKSVTKLPTCSRSYRYLFFFVWKLIRLQIIFTKTAGIEIDLTVAPVCHKYWYKRFFWKLYSLLHISTWRRQWLYQSRYKFNLHKYSQSYTHIFTFCTFTFLEKYLSRQNKICQAVL